MNEKELFLMVEAISNEKNISKNDVFESLEEALAVVTKKNAKIDARVEVDRKNGVFRTYRQWLVVEDGCLVVGEEEEPFDETLHVYQKNHPKLSIGDYVSEEIPTQSFGRIAAQIVKQVIIQKVRDAERAMVVFNYSARVGEVVNVMVKRVDRGNVYVDLGGVDGLISRFDLIPNESVRKGDRLRAYIKEVKSSARGAQVFLSRTVVEMMVELFKMEVPEISDGVIKIMSGARDPGLRSKIAVRTKDRRLDPIGSCIGMRGSRVHAVSNEFNGERIDVVLWDEDPAQFAINAIAPAEALSISMDENQGVMDLVIAEEQLALVIGRNGQNIKLASKLVGWKLNVFSVEEAENKRLTELKEIRKSLLEKLSLTESTIQKLVEVGFRTIDEIAGMDEAQLMEITGFEASVVTEIIEKASDAQLVQALGDSDAAELLTALPNVDDALAERLIESEILSVDDLADLSAPELLDLCGIDEALAQEIVMAARKEVGLIE